MQSAAGRSKILARSFLCLKTLHQTHKKSATNGGITGNGLLKIMTLTHLNF